MTTIQELLDRIIYDEMKFKDLQKYSITSFKSIQDMQQLLQVLSNSAQMYYKVFPF